MPVAKRSDVLTYCMNACGDLVDCVVVHSKQMTTCNSNRATADPVYQLNIKDHDQEEELAIPCCLP